MTTYSVWMMGGTIYIEEHGKYEGIRAAKQAARAYVRTYSKNKEQASYARMCIADVTARDIKQDGTFTVDA